MYGIFTYIYHKNATKCREIYHTWILWEITLKPLSFPPELITTKRPTPASRQPLGGRLGKGGASHGSRGATIVRLLFFKGYPQGINIFEDDFPLPVWWDMGMFPRGGSLRSSKCITKHIGKTEMLTKTGIQRGTLIWNCDYDF